MLELGIGADFIREIGLIYQLCALALLAFAIWYGRTWKRKVLYALLVSTIVLGPVLPHIYQTIPHKHKYVEARAIFSERCKAAGEKINSRVLNVEGVLLLNLRPDDKAANRNNPNWPDAGLPDEAGGESYIHTFISWEHQQFPPQRGYLNSEPISRNGHVVISGYAFVDIQEENGTISRHRYRKPPSLETEKATVAANAAARYAVAFRNLTDASDRARWIAGTTVTVTDRQTSEVLAEKTWYSFDPGQGSEAAGRRPWGFAETCPELTGWRGAATRMFVDQVLIPMPEAVK